MSTVLIGDRFPQEAFILPRVGQNMNRYAQRDLVLSEMGYSSYREYLESPLWARIRAKILRACPLCVCGQPATQVHHRSYKRRYLEGRGKVHKFLTPICRNCHSEIEFSGSEKLPLGWANHKLDDIRTKAERDGIFVPQAARTKTQRRGKPGRTFGSGKNASRGPNSVKSGDGGRLGL